MTTKAMLQFVSREKEMPIKRGAEARRQDFHEIYDDFNDEKAEQKGYRYIFAGSMSGIRNPRAHSANYPETIDECLDHLSIASALMRRLDTAS